MREREAKTTVTTTLSSMADAMGNPEEEEKGPAYEVPAHLRDLPPEELPEEHRGSVLSEISMFREQAAKREEAKKLRESELERQRAADRARANMSGPGASRGGSGQSMHGTPNGQGYYEGAQSYLKPVGFVPGQGGSGTPSEGRPVTDMEPEEQDEDEERRRRERKEFEVIAAARDVSSFDTSRTLGTLGTTSKRRRKQH